MNTFRLLICIYFGFVAFSNAQTTATYAANFKFYNDPAVTGALTGTVYFDAAGGAMKLRYDYTIGVIEMFNFTAQIRYLGCLSGTTYDCDAETFRVPFPTYYREGNEQAAGNTFTSADGRQCTRYNKVNPPSKGVTAIWLDANNFMCRAIFDGTTKTIDFTNVRALPTTDFLLYKQWNCPQQQCNKMMDFILVFDESGSIDGTSFQREKDFAISVANSYTFGPYGVAMGLVMFSGSARRIIYPNTNQQSVINAINGVVQDRGSTCIPCGVDIAVSDFTTRGRSGATSIMIVLTDGQNNVRDSDFVPTMNSVHARNPRIYVFAIGVAGYDINQLNVIGSTISGVQTVFTTPSFSQLAGLLNQLVVATCLDLPGNPCGPGCRGACICNQVCKCPDSCDDGNPCTQDMCTPGSGGNGCVYPATVCNDNNACTSDTCNPSTGCVFTNITCNDNSRCTTDTCIPSAGCQYNPVNCDDRNPCTGDTCSPAAGCQYAPVDCNRCLYPVNVTCPRINCFINECHPGNGSCVARAVVCDDGNACTNDYCNPTTGLCATRPVVCNDNNRCTHDTCDPQSGCQYIPFNVPVECNDYSNCTIDSCSPSLGCVYTNITCNDGDACTSDICESAIGCTYPTKDCSKELTVGACSVAACDSSRGCYLEPIPSLTLDCGLCALSGESCADQGLGAGDIAGISAGVIAGIVIAVVAVVAVAGGFGGKKLYDVYLKNKGNMQGAQMSPLYKDNGLSGTNPLFEHPQ